MNKTFFVRKFLRPLIKAVDKDVDEVYYLKTADGEEFVNICYLNGSKRRIIVTGDSLKAIVQDVIKNI